MAKGVTSTKVLLGISDAAPTLACCFADRSSQRHFAQAPRVDGYTWDSMAHMLTTYVRVSDIR
jgi:hypothetical protein